MNAFGEARQDDVINIHDDQHSVTHEHAIPPIYSSKTKSNHPVLHVVVPGLSCQRVPVKSTLQQHHWRPHSFPGRRPQPTWQRYKRIVARQQSLQVRCIGVERRSDTPWRHAVGDSRTCCHAGCGCVSAVVVELRFVISVTNVITCHNQPSTKTTKVGESSEPFSLMIMIDREKRTGLPGRL